MDADEPRDVDVLIDGIARAMTDDQPSHGLRAAVRRRIDAPVPKTAAWRPWAAAAPAAIVAAAAVWQLWQLNDRAAVRHVPGRSAAIAPVPVRPEPATEPAAEAPEAAAGITAGQRASADQAAPRAIREVARQSRGPAGESSIVEIEPLAIAPLNAAAIEVDAVVGPSGVDIEPIAIRPLAIGPSASDALE